MKARCIEVYKVEGRALLAWRSASVREREAHFKPEAAL